ncbi:hypothetical protein CWI36_2717p0010, partial [Hamiltosporidium magnivora]
VISGLPIFPKNNYIFLHFTNIKPNRIRYYKLALRSLNENILKNISNLDFINENTLEVICKEDSKQEIIKTFEEFPAKYVNKHPDLNEDGLLNIKAIKERMKKISKREKLINIRLKRFATKINMLEGTKLIEFLRTTGIEAIDTCTYDNSKLSKTKANISFRLFELDLYNTTYTHNNFNTTPDKIFSNFLVKPHIFPINHIDHKLIITEFLKKSQQTPKFK